MSDNKSGASVQEHYRKTTEVVREKEHIVRRMLDVDIPGKRRRERPILRWKDACKRDMTEVGLKGDPVERGQRNKQGRMEEEANQLYRGPQMTGQAREEEE